MSKEMEGDEDQRRAASRAAHRAGEEPSALGATTGASKQRHHLRHGEESHEERLIERHRGKQKQQSALQPPGPAEEERPFEDRPEYDAEHQRVFQALEEAEAANGGNGVYLQDLAGAVGLPVEETRQVLHDLTRVQRLVTELEGTDHPDLGPRFTIKQRL